MKVMILLLAILFSTPGAYACVAYPKEMSVKMMEAALMALKSDVTPDDVSVVNIQVSNDEVVLTLDNHINGSNTIVYGINWTTNLFGSCARATATKR